MNSSVIAKRSNITFFVVACFLALAMLSVGGYLLTGLISGKSGQHLQVAEKSCLMALKASGYLADSSAAATIQVMKMSANIEQLVYQSSVLIASCPAYTLTEYCAGITGCKSPGVSFTLTTK